MFNLKLDKSHTLSNYNFLIRKNIELLPNNMKKHNFNDKIMTENKIPLKFSAHKRESSEGIGKKISKLYI